MLLRNTILDINQKFDTFNTVISDKVERIERNYEDLNSKLDTLVTKAQTTNYWCFKQRVNFLNFKHNLILKLKAI